MLPQASLTNLSVYRNIYSGENVFPLKRNLAIRFNYRNDELRKLKRVNNELRFCLHSM